MLSSITINLLLATPPKSSPTTPHLIEESPHCNRTAALTRLPVPERPTPVSPPRSGRGHVGPQPAAPSTEGRCVTWCIASRHVVYCVTSRGAGSTHTGSDGDHRGHLRERGRRTGDKVAAGRGYVYLPCTYHGFSERKQRLSKLAGIYVGNDFISRDGKSYVVVCKLLWIFR